MTLQERLRTPFQARVHQWMLTCFGAEITADTVERNHRFLEEALELVQACGCTESEAIQLVHYVYDRPTGERVQEAGGVMVTLAALCIANAIDVEKAGEIELARISAPGTIEKIRAKQAAKPKHSPLPQPTLDAKDAAIAELVAGLESALPHLTLSCDAKFSVAKLRTLISKHKKQTTSNQGVSS